MKNSYWLMLILLFLTSCTTVEFVRKDLSPTKQAVLRYAPQSNPEREAKYRSKLSNEATNFCGGNFQITKEYEAREETGASSGIGTGFGFGRGDILIGGSSRSTQMYHFVEISCT